MPRHTSFRFCLDLSLKQEGVLSRHVGAARFAFNQALRLHQDARSAAYRGQPPAIGTGPDGEQPGGGSVPGVRVPWSGFDLINAFNAWKRSEAAGRRFLVDATGQVRAHGPVVPVVQDLLRLRCAPQGPHTQGPHLRVPRVWAPHGPGSECRRQSRRLGREPHPHHPGRYCHRRCGAWCRPGRGPSSSRPRHQRLLTGHPPPTTPHQAVAARDWTT